MGPLCQRSTRDGRSPCPGAFKRFPLHLNRVWQRWCSENTTRLVPLRKWVEEHIWGCCQRLALAPEVRSPWLALSAVSGERLCHCFVRGGNAALKLAIQSQELSLLQLFYLLVSRSQPDTGTGLPNMTKTQRLLHMDRNRTSGLQGSLRFKCEHLRSSDVSRIS